LNNGAISIYFSLLFIVLHFDEKSIHTFILYPDILKNVTSSISILCTNLVMGAFCIGYTIIRYRAFSKISTIIIQWIFGLFWMGAKINHIFVEKITPLYFLKNRVRPF